MVRQKGALHMTIEPQVDEVPGEIALMKTFSVILQCASHYKVMKVEAPDGSKVHEVLEQNGELGDVWYIYRIQELDPGVPVEVIGTFERR